MISFVVEQDIFISIKETQMNKPFEPEQDNACEGNDSEYHPLMVNFFLKGISK